MLLVWLQILLEKLVCLSMIEYVGGGDSSPREVCDRFAAAVASLYKPVAPSVSDVYKHQETRFKDVKMYLWEQVHKQQKQPGIVVLQDNYNSIHFVLR